VLEELVLYLEKETSEYLERLLPPRTDYSVSISINKEREGVDVALEVLIRGRLEEFREEARDAVSYARRKLIDWLEAYKSKSIHGYHVEST
jgi:hypothetical protein